MTPHAIVGLLSSVALVMLIVAGWKWRGEKGTALFCLAGGLIIGGLAIFKVWPALTDETHFAESEALRQQLSDARVAVAEHQRRAKADAEAIALASRRVAATEHRLAVTDADSLRVVGTFEEAIAELQRRFRSTSSDVILDLPSRAPVAAMAGFAERGEAAAAAVKDLHFLRARPTAMLPTQDQTRQDATRDMVRLRDRLAQPVRTETYEVEPYPTRDLVGGRQGRYYAIDIKNAASGIRYFFEGGKYTLRTGTPEFRSSLNSFIADVLGKLEGNVRYDLYVRGSADQKPYEGRMEPGSEYQQVSYLRAVGPDRYTAEQVKAEFDRGIVRNADLPNLRAAYMRDLVASTYPIKPPVILQGTVTPKVDDRDRNVELILFVEW